MALTTAQEIALFQILEVPWCPSGSDQEAGHLVGGDNMLVERAIVRSSQSMQAAALIRSWVAALGSDAETVLVAYLTEWITLGTDTTDLVGASVGGYSGITDTPESTRLEIRRQVIVLVPYYRHHEVIERDSRSGGSVNLIRGA